VLETNVHYPTDLNLLWDAQRKCADLLKPMVARYQIDQIEGWRKQEDWRRKLKRQMVGLTRLLSGGGPNKVERCRRSAEAYVADSYRFEAKVFGTIQELPAPRNGVEVLRREQLDYFHTMMIKQLDLVERRLIGHTVAVGVHSRIYRQIDEQVHALDAATVGFTEGEVDGCGRNERAGDAIHRGGASECRR
jgi:hypothetical protein